MKQQPSKPQHSRAQLSAQPLDDRTTTHMSQASCKNIVNFMDRMLFEDRLERTHALVAEIRREEDHLYEKSGSKGKTGVFKKGKGLLLQQLGGSSGKKAQFAPVPFKSEEQEDEAIRAAARYIVHTRVEVRCKGCANCP